jgi:hypothetical protein
MSSMGASRAGQAWPLPACPPARRACGAMHPRMRSPSSDLTRLQQSTGGKQQRWHEQVGQAWAGDKNVRSCRVSATQHQQGRMCSADSGKVYRACTGRGLPGLT